MAEDIFKTFTFWGYSEEEFSKARKPKGLENWSRLSYMADKLKGKKSSDLSFTTAYPGHEGKTKILGSVEGNLHFLMGYGNPGFYLAPYHYMIMDPSLTEEDALRLYKMKGHPSCVELWERSGLETKPEGDEIDGSPHPAFEDVVEIQKIKNAKKAESITVSSGVGSYTAIPSEGMVYGNHNNHVYAWDMVSESFFAAANPDLAAKMDAAAAERSLIEEEISKTLSVPELVKHVANEFDGLVFEDDVYPLVKSHFPVPGSIIPVDTETGESVYGIITSEDVVFVDREGGPINLDVYGSVFKSIDLTRSGNVYSSVLYNFGTQVLGISEDLDQYISKSAEKTLNPRIQGNPTEGFSNISGEVEAIAESNKSVIRDESNTFRLVVRDN